MQVILLQYIRPWIVYLTNFPVYFYISNEIESAFCIGRVGIKFLVVSHVLLHYKINDE